MKKNKVIGLLATLGCIAVGAGATMITPVTAKAETPEVLDSIAANFTMEYGASVRLGEESGIRFTATLDQGVYNQLQALETDTVKVNYGMLIIPKDYEAEINAPKSVFDDEKYCLSAAETCTCTKTHIAAVEYEELSSEPLVETDTKTGVMYLRGSLVGIEEYNLTREFVGVGYIEYVADGASSYYLAAYAKENEESEANIENNTRSMTYVAQLAIADDKDTDGTLQTNYVAPLAGKQYKYTVNHYLPTSGVAFDGNGRITWTNATWEIAKTEAQYGTLSTMLKTADLAKTDATSLDCAEYVALAHYADKKDSSLLYANGKTTLDVYYTVSGNAETGKTYDMLSEITTASETVTDTQLNKEVLKFEDHRLAGRNSKGIFIGLNYSEALAIQQIIYQEKLNEKPTFTWTLRVKVESPTDGAHAAPRCRLAGATSAATTGLTAEIVPGGGTLNETTHFAYDCWVEFTFSSSICNGYSRDYGNLVNYLIGAGDSGCIWIHNAFKNSNNDTSAILNVYIDEFSFSVA